MNNTLKEQLQAIAQRRDQPIVRLDLAASLAQTHAFYETVVTPAFETLHRELPKGNVPHNISRTRGWNVVHICQVDLMRTIHYEIIPRHTASHAYVRAAISITDRQGTYGRREKNLRGSKNKPHIEITQDDIVRGFVDLYERMLSLKR